MVTAPETGSGPSASRMLFRFVTCGVLSVGAGLAWRATAAPSRVGVGSALGGILVLLAGFVAGGLVWFAGDVRGRARGARGIDDGRLAFSFVIFTMIPLAALILIAGLWVLVLALER